MTNTGERQIGTTLEEIRADHRARYEWAAKYLHPHQSKTVLDAGCGIGYGSKILADAGFEVTAIDRDREAIQYAQTHWRHPNIEYHEVACESVMRRWTSDAIVAFEILEHLKTPEEALVRWGSMANTLLASVPNEECFPYTGQAFHHRHYTREEFSALLERCGWKPVAWFGQEGPESPVEPEINGRTILCVAVKSGLPTWQPQEPRKYRYPSDPVGLESVAIVAMGSSHKTYVSLASGSGGKQKIAQEVWAVNNMGNVIRHDRLFHMDDLKIQEARALARPDSSIAGMMSWMKTHDRPIYTSRSYSDYVQSYDFPLEDVMNSVGAVYFNSTVAYAVAYAIHLKVKKIHLYGVDYSYANGHQAEKGRACVECLLGIALARDINVQLPADSSLMDANVSRHESYYGYDTEWIDTAPNEEGRMIIARTLREECDIPTVEEIERRYDHQPR